MSFGTNYGILFTARGIGGLVLSRLQQMLTAQNGGSFTSSFALRLSGCDAGVAGGQCSVGSGSEFACSLRSAA